MANTESMEMYLETVYVLENNHGHAHGVEIAKRLGVSKPSVTKAMNFLKANGLIQKEAYGSITLTEKGREVSARIYSNHKKISLFLEHALGLEAEEADGNACKMEHVLSDTMVKAIENYLKNNQVDY